MFSGKYFITTTDHLRVLCRAESVSLSIHDVSYFIIPLRTDIAECLYIYIYQTQQNRQPYIRAYPSPQPEKKTFTSSTAPGGLSIECGYNFSVFVVQLLQIVFCSSSLYLFPYICVHQLSF